MSAEAKGALPTPAEKPNHYTYLKEFRVEQCPLFVQYKCPSHKPYSCFHWHFFNQRRRRPLRRRDGTFNYSPDVYCTKYDEASGICPDGDDCSYLHKTAGDTEKRYHLRYYKTCMCVHDTDAKGFCKKNGAHCAFAHGVHDLRAPVLDIREIQAQQEGCDENGTNGSSLNNLDKERTMTEDPRWQDTTYVLANYKTELCKKPPRLCRQGYTCPQYHNSRDRRRTPLTYKYRTTPCPHVKRGDEWGEPTNCEAGDDCQYCHTRTEQQFHPEIYKSTKCNDMMANGYCPRGAFCAFAHVEQEIVDQRGMCVMDGTNNIVAILSGAMTVTTSASGTTDSTNILATSNDILCSNSNNNGNHNNNNNLASSGALTVTTNSILNKTATGQHSPPSSIDTFNGRSLPAPIAKPATCNSDPLSTYQKAPGSEREDKEANARKHSLILGHALGPLSSNSSLVSPYYPASETVESVVGNALDDLNLDDIDDNSTMADLEGKSDLALSGPGLLGTSAPVNIPNSNSLGGLSCGSTPPLSTTPPGFLTHPDRAIEQAVAAAFLGQSNALSSSTGSNKFSSFTNTNLFPDLLTAQTTSPVNGGQPLPSPIISNTPSQASSADMKRLWDELEATGARLISCEEVLAQAVAKVHTLQKEVASYLPGNMLNNSNNPPPGYGQQPVIQAVKCIICDDKNRSITFLPCSHTLVCSECASTTTECPYCRTQVVRWVRNTAFPVSPL